MTTPYTYFLRWTKLNTNYYGVRYARGCNPNDLWTKYFTSSNKVKKFRKFHGEPDVVQVRKTFTTSDAARLWEHRFLTRVDAVNNSTWLNEHAGGKKGFRIKYGSDHQNFGKRWTFTEEQKLHQSISHKKLRWWNNGVEQSFSELPPGNDYVRGRLPFNNAGAKKGTDIQRGKIWITDGVTEQMILPTDTIPDGYHTGRVSSKFKGKNRHTRGSHWWTNGRITKMSPVSPGPEWRRGRTT